MKKTCEQANCDRHPYRSGLCSAHYQRKNAGKPLNVPIRFRAKPGEWRRCSVQGCMRAYSAQGLCESHYHWLNRTGVVPTHALARRGPRGHGTVTPDGYRVVRAPGHLNARLNNKIEEHRLVMSRLIGRPLRDDESVHHKNGNRLDNRPENLELWGRGQPSGQRITDRVNWAIDLLATYAPRALSATAYMEIT